MKPVLTRWLLIWLRAKKLPNLSDAEIIEFLTVGINASASITSKLKSVLGDDHVKMLNLGYDWLQSYLPFVLQKVNRVHFGLLLPADIAQLEADGVKIPSSRKLTAVPFVAKDVPSRASEFAHPDILIGLTLLAFRYEGLRERDFSLVMRHLKDCLEMEGGPYRQRPSCQLFERWVLCAGRRIRGSKKKETRSRRSIVSDTASISVTTTATTAANRSAAQQQQVINVFADVFLEDDELIWPLQLVDARDKEQFRVIYPLLFKLPHVVMYYLSELIFPEVLAHQGLKLSTWYIHTYISAALRVIPHLHSVSYMNLFI
jgi:hypothetical protein